MIRSKDRDQAYTQGMAVRCRSMTRKSALTHPVNDSEVDLSSLRTYSPDQFGRSSFTSPHQLPQNLFCIHIADGDMRKHVDVNGRVVDWETSSEWSGQGRCPRQPSPSLIRHMSQPAPSKESAGSVRRQTRVTDGGGSGRARNPRHYKSMSPHDCNRRGTLYDEGTSRAASSASAICQAN